MLTTTKSEISLLIHLLKQ